MARRFLPLLWILSGVFPVYAIAATVQEDVLGLDQPVTGVQSQQQAARQIIREMLTKNTVWLTPRAVFDSLQYAFHTENQDVKEECVVLIDGLAAFEIVHDGKGEMKNRLGDRTIALADGRTASAKRDERWAAILEAATDRRGPDRAEQMRRYALIGCQFDMPLFEMDRLLDKAKIEIADGDWKGIPCHVATITHLPRSTCLGCGVMLGFTSWSYVHHLYPAYEVIYIDKERLVPLHETFVDLRDDRRFEIDYSEYVTFKRDDSESLAPLQIDLVSEDYFTCRYTFQGAADCTSIDVAHHATRLLLLHRQ